MQKIWSLAVIISGLNAGVAFAQASLLQQGRQCLDIKQYERALALFQQFSQAAFENPEGYFWQGVAFDEMGRYEDASRAYQQAINCCEENSMDSVEIRINLGNAFLKLHKPDEAIVQYHRAINIDRRAAGAYLNLARAFIEKADWQAALESLNQAAKCGNDTAQLSYYRVKVLAGAGQKAEARVQLDLLLKRLNDGPQKNLIKKEFESLSSS
ncbi:MAG: tetratricopeptide repeat protein [Candidatus Obscuribacterales bacterium]|nr:tetratricopeptide repeat protein [Candidatus Obscuribacterales bacterium]